MHEGRLLPQKRTMGLRTCNLQAAPSSWPGACYRGIPQMPTATRSSSQPARLVLLAAMSMVCLRLQWRAYSRSYAPGPFGSRNHLEIIGM